VLLDAGDKPMTFSGSSYVRWRLSVPMEKRLNLRLELRTVQPRARLMHAVGRVDYSILEVRKPNQYSTSSVILHLLMFFNNSNSTHAHMFNGRLSGTTQESRYQKGKTNLGFAEARVAVASAGPYASLQLAPDR